MFDKIASLQVCRIPVLHLFLASLAFHGILGSDTTYEKFGCEFTGDQYKTIYKHYDYFKYPVYGEKSMDPFQMGMSEKLKLKPYPNKKLILNDVSPFRRFIQELGKEIHHPADGKTICLLCFFKDYDVPFQQNAACSDPACFLISMMINECLVMSYGITPNILPFYIANAYVDPVLPDGFKSAYRDDLILTNMNHKSPQDHLAAVYKIFHPSSKRAGYVITDPGYANGVKVIHPFVATVMEDGKAPPKGFPSGLKNEEIEFSMSGKGTKGKPFILATHKKSSNTTVSRVLYYVDKPYCSFMENTIKANLLRANHGIIRFDENGNTNGYLTFKASSHSSERTNTGLQFLTTEGNSKDIKEMTNYEVSCTKDKNNKPNEEIKMIVKKTFGTSSEDVELVRSITEDLQFIYGELCDSKVWSSLNELAEQQGRDIANQRDPKTKSTSLSNKIIGKATSCLKPPC